jgi:hypothetical protein
MKMYIYAYVYLRVHKSPFFVNLAHVSLALRTLETYALLQHASRHAVYISTHTRASQHTRAHTQQPMLQVLDPARVYRRSR